jgi:hypothetical protein
MDILFRCDGIVVYKYKAMKVYGTSKISVYEKQQKLNLMSLNFHTSANETDLRIVFSSRIISAV